MENRTKALALVPAAGIALLFVVAIQTYRLPHPSMFGMSTGQTLVPGATVLAVALAIFVGRDLSGRSRRLLAIGMAVLLLAAATSMFLSYVGLIGGPPMHT
jgi:hypothetical protein